MTQVSQVSSTERWFITVAIMSATLMQVLDTTIVNVALPHMQGSLGASPDEITWTLTSYLVASAIFMPLTGYFADILGRKNYLLVSIVGFTFSSALCGAANSIFSMVLFRLLQGVFGAGLVPISQAIMADIFPDNERGKAMAIWGMGVMVGPILGPSLGGYLTDVASWRWTFYVNIPFGIAAIFLILRFVPVSIKKSRTLDWFGMILLAVAIGCTQYILDRGNQRDWWQSVDIQISTVVAFLSLFAFVLYSIGNKSQMIFDLRIFKDRNFTLSSLLLALLGLGLYGSMVIQPQLLEVSLGYPILLTGIIMAPRGVASMISMMLVGKLITKVDTRWMISLGIFLGAFGIYFSTLYSLDISKFWIIFPMMLQGFGLGMIFVPLSSIAFSTLPPNMRAEAAGLYSLLRTIGSSIGISITATFLSRHVQQAWNQIGSTITPFNPALSNYLKPLHTDAYHTNGMALLIRELARQAQMLAYVNTFAFIMWSFLIMLPFVFLLKKKTN